MSWFERLRRGSQPNDPNLVSCSGCGKTIGTAKMVQHNVQAGAASVYFCESCYRKLLSNDEKLDATRASLIASGVVDKDRRYQCRICGQVCDADRMFGADLSKELDRKDILLSFSYTRNPRAGEGTNPVFMLRKACMPCVSGVLPGLSPNWMKDTEKFSWMKNHIVPF